MAIAQIPNQDNGAVNFLSELFKNSNTLFGSGESTTTTKDSADPTAIANSNNLLQSLMAGNNSADIDTMIQGILDQAKKSFGPNIAQSIGSGNRALSDTTLATIQGQAQGTATAEAARAKLDAISKNNQVMAQVVNGQIDASKTRTTTQKTEASPAGKGISALGLAGTVYSAGKKLLKPQAPSPVTTGVPSSVNSATGLATGATGVTSAASGFNYSTDMSPYIGDGSTGVGDLFDFSGTTANDVFTNFSDFGSGLDIFSGSGIADFGSNFADFGTDFLGNLGSTGGDYVPGLGTLMDLGEGDWGGAIGSGIGGYFGGAPGAFIGEQLGDPIQQVLDNIDDFLLDSVICSELVRQGFVSARERVKNYIIFKKNLSETTIRGYKWWGKFFVKQMRKSSLWTKFGKLILNSWIKEMKTKNSIFGKFVHYVIRPISFLIGFILGVRIWNKQKLIA